MPGFVRRALEAEGLKDRYDQRPWYQRNDYMVWINTAKREETKQKRLNQMLRELKAGDANMQMKWQHETRSDD